MNEGYDKSGNRPHLYYKNNASMESLEPLKEFFEELELSRNHLEHAQQIARIGSWEYNIPQDALTFSAYARDIFNSSQLNSKSQLKDVLAYVHSEDYDRTTKKLTEAVTKGIGFTSDFRILHDKTGDVRYIKAQAETIWKDNKPYKLVGVVKDQTAQHYLEEEIDESRKRTRLILDHLSIGIWMKDYISGKVEYVSKA